MYERWYILYKHHDGISIYNIYRDLKKTKKKKITENKTGADDEMLIWE